MDHLVVPLYEGNYFKAYFDEIPPNCIINKTIPGLGATRCEIEAERNSIIIEPNVPVIEGKMIKHPNILGVIRDVSKKTIRDYLKNDVKYKKIVTTPESYTKVQEVFIILKINYLEDYFMLLDECEKMISDVDYRESIIYPITDFWKFRKKSMISATPLLPSFPNCNQILMQLTLKPHESYHYQNDITIIKTNNTLAMIKQYLGRSLEDKKNISECFCFFINSTNVINALIDQLEIKDISNVYGSDQCVKKLTSKGLTNVFRSLSTLKPINFFTSRFFSAVDIELKFKPHIIIITDLLFAPYSMVIPQIDTVQIFGRFRNGIKSISHIVNINKKTSKRTIDDVKKQLESERIAYDKIDDLYELADETGKAIFKQALDRVDFKRFVTPDNYINWFMIDNECLKQWTNNIYYNFSDLLAQYEKTSFFKVKSTEINFNFEEHERLKRIGINKKERRKEIISRLEFFSEDIENDHNAEYEELKKEDELIVNVFNHKSLGRAFIEKVNYNTQLMTIEYIKESSKVKKNSFEVLDAVNKSFIIGYSYSEKDIKKRILNVFQGFGIEEKAKGSTINDFFEVSERKNIKQKGIDPNKRQKGFQIIKRKYNIPSNT